MPEGKNINTDSKGAFNIGDGLLYACEGYSKEGRIVILVKGSEVFVAAERLGSKSPFKVTMYELGSEASARNYGQGIRVAYTKDGRISEWGMTHLSQSPKRTPLEYSRLIGGGPRNASIHSVMPEAESAADVWAALSGGQLSPATSVVVNDSSDRSTPMRKLEPHMSPSQYMKELMG